MKNKSDAIFILPFLRDKKIRSEKERKRRKEKVRKKQRGIPCCVIKPVVFICFFFRVIFISPFSIFHLLPLSLFLHFMSPFFLFFFFLSFVFFLLFQKKEEKRFCFDRKKLQNQSRTKSTQDFGVEEKEEKEGKERKKRKRRIWNRKEVGSKLSLEKEEVDHQSSHFLLSFSFFLTFLRFLLLSDLFTFKEGERILS